MTRNRLALFLALVIGVAMALPANHAQADIGNITTGPQTSTAVQGGDGTGINMPILSGQNTCSVTASDTVGASYTILGSNGVNYSVYNQLGTNGVIQVTTSPVTTSVNVANLQGGFIINWRSNTGSLTYSIICSGATTPANINSSVSVPAPAGAVINPPCTLNVAGQSCTMVGLGPSSGCTVFISQSGSVAPVGTFNFFIVSPLGNVAPVGAASFDAFTQGTFATNTNAYQAPCSGASQFIVSATALSAGAVTVEIISSPYGSITGVQSLSSCTAQNPLTFPINLGSSVTTQIIGLTVGVPINTCGGSFTLTGTSPTATMVYGTGANCVTGQHPLSGAYTFTSSGYVSLPNFQVPSGNELCVTTAATTSIQGMITAAQPAAAGPQPTAAPTPVPTATPTAAPPPNIKAGNLVSAAATCVNGSNPINITTQPPANSTILIIQYGTYINGAMTAPAGFTVNNAGPAIGAGSLPAEVWSKIATGAEGTSYPYTLTATAGRCDYYVMEIDNAATASPIDFAGINEVTSVNGTTTFAAATQTPSQASDLGIAALNGGQTAPTLLPVVSSLPAGMGNPSSGADLGAQLFTIGLGAGAFAPSVTYTTGVTTGLVSAQVNIGIKAAASTGGAGNIATFDGCNVGTSGDVYNAPATGSADANSNAIFALLGSGSVDNPPSTLTEFVNEAVTATNTFQETPTSSHNPIWANTGGANPSIPWIFSGYANSPTGAYQIETTSDRHAFVVQKNSCTEYETYNQSQTPPSSLSAYSGLEYALGSSITSQFPPAGTTFGTTAAGFPLFMGMIHSEDMTGGAINHAVNIELHCASGSCPGISQWGYVGLATSGTGLACTGSCGGPLLHYGAHLRLKATVTCPTSGQGLILCTALKTYGAFFTDTGSDNGFYWSLGVNGIDGINHSQVNAFMSTINLSSFEILPQGAVSCNPGHAGCI